NSIGELANAAINSNPLSKLKALNKSLMSESNLLAAVRESMENTNLILKSLDQPEWIESINKINHLSIKVFDQNDAYSQLIENIESLSKLYKFEAFNSIGSLRNSPLNRFSELVESTFTHSKDIYNIHKLVDDINTEIAQTDDFEKLPATVQNKIFHFLNCVFLTICLNLFSSFLYEQIISLAKVLQPLTQSSEIKSFARNASAHYDRDLLSSFRVIIGKNVNLRASPSMSSDVILQLNIGTLVEVLDKSDRAWLLVEISDGDDIIQGWVARRYTTYFK
ncbi:MAG: SH3 domain-containing protein, partial [Alcaligenaceae bacterium]|nr:SH3 domain-containing protein [Alcaligenaceae bacterium]